MEKLNDKEKKLFVIHPFLFAIFPVLFLFAHNIHNLSFIDIIIPLGIYLGAALVLWLVLSFLLNKTKSGMIVSLSLILFFTYGHLYIFLNFNSEIESEITRQRYLLPLFIGLLIVGVTYFVRTSRKLNNITTIINVISVTIIVLSIINIGTFYLEREQFIENSNELITQNMDLRNVQNPPNIYHIVLDAYGGDKIFKKEFGYDNSEFTNFLKNNGFYIPENARSNYPETNLAITSMLEMKHLTYMQDTAGESKEIVHVRNMLGKNQVMTDLKNAGYTIINFNSSLGKDAINFSDLFLCTNNTITESPLLIQLTRTSMLYPIYTEFFVGDHKETILCMFSELPILSQKVNEPFFVYAHFLLPHAPYVFGPNGESITPISLDIGLYDLKYKGAYIDQVKFANKQLKQIIEKILKVDNDAIIIIQGDHGSQLTMNWNNPNIEMIDERMSILNAYHLPRGGEQFLYDSITPVNTYRVIFNAFFNGTYSYVEDKQYFSTYDRPFIFKDVTEMLNANQ